LAGWGRALGMAAQSLAKVTQQLWAAGDPRVTLANASVYLEAFGHVVIAWIWLEQALAAARALPGAQGDDAGFYRGKLQAARYFFQWELPKTGPQLALLASLDTTTLDMQDAWF
ncbi:acyl-CoA dehydrogenase C-terminal domain-containing protein, partial [Ralstonia pseudosolanacearum]